MYNLLLVDMSNLCFREFYSNKNLSHKGRNVDVIYGVLKSLISFQKDWPNHKRICAWDGGYTRRLAESKMGVANGIIPASYKQNRRDKKEETPDPKMESLFEQMDIVKDVLKNISCLQVREQGYEADDMINSYAKWAEARGGESVIVSSDKDFYQCITDKTIVYNPRTGERWTKERFELEFGFSPEKWVDVGALEGEVSASGDNIFGATGWGPVTTRKYVREFGTVESIIASVKSKKDRSKKEDVLLEQEQRVILAKSLKRMDCLPISEVKFPEVDVEVVKKTMLEWGFASLLKDAVRLT